jgi:hypothetical protein
MSQDADRYREAASDALKMLDWCIFYFRHEGHGEIAKRLEQNRDYIREQLTGEPEETLEAQGETRPLANVPMVNPLRRALEAVGLKPETRTKRR